MLYVAPLQAASEGVSLAVRGVPRGRNRHRWDSLPVCSLPKQAPALLLDINRCHSAARAQAPTVERSYLSRYSMVYVLRAPSMRRTQLMACCWQHRSHTLITCLRRGGKRAWSAAARFSNLGTLYPENPAPGGLTRLACTSVVGDTIYGAAKQR